LATKGHPFEKARRAAASLLHANKRLFHCGLSGPYVIMARFDRRFPHSNQKLGLVWCGSNRPLRCRNADRGQA